MNDADLFDIYQKARARAQADFPHDGPDCWDWHAQEAADHAANGFATIAG